MLLVILVSPVGLVRSMHRITAQPAATCSWPDRARTHPDSSAACPHTGANSYHPHCCKERWSTIQLTAAPFTQMQLPIADRLHCKVSAGGICTQQRTPNQLALTTQSCRLQQSRRRLDFAIHCSPPLSRVVNSLLAVSRVTASKLLTSRAFGSRCASQIV